MCGLTLTCPDICPFLEDLRVEKYRGRADRRGGMGPAADFDVWDLSTIKPAATVAQPKSPMPQASSRCRDQEGDQCAMYFVLDLRI